MIVTIVDLLLFFHSEDLLSVSYVEYTIVLRQCLIKIRFASDIQLLIASLIDRSITPTLFSP